MASYMASRSASVTRETSKSADSSAFAINLASLTGLSSLGMFAGSYPPLPTTSARGDAAGAAAPADHSTIPTVSPTNAATTLRVPGDIRDEETPFIVRVQIMAPSRARL